MSNVTVQKALKNALFTIRCYRAEITLDKKRPNDLIEVDLVISEIDAALAEIEKCEPFGYFKAEPFGWTDCAETDEGAIALHEAPTFQRGEWVRVEDLQRLYDDMLRHKDIAITANSLFKLINND